MTDLFTLKPKIVRIEGEPGTEFDGLWLDVRKVQTWPEYNALIEALYWADIHEQLAFYIQDWNLTATRIVEETKPAIMDGETVIAPERVRRIAREAPLPSPAVGGADVFLTLPSDTKSWLRLQVIASMYHRDDDPKVRATPLRPSRATRPEKTQGDTSAKTGRQPRSNSKKHSPVISAPSDHGTSTA